MSIPIAASALFHTAHYGLLFGIPVVTLLVLAIASGRNPPKETFTDEEVARRDAMMRLSFGQLAPSRLTTQPRPAVSVELPRRVDVAGVVLASLSAGAGLIHAAVITSHFRQDWIYGTFFVASAVAQVLWAIAVLWRPSRGLLVAGIVGNAAIIAVWIVSRTTGLPFGPTPGVVESLGWADGIASAYEGIIVAGSLVQLGRETRFTAKVSIPMAALIGTFVLFAAGVAGAAGHTG